MRKLKRNNCIPNYVSGSDIAGIAGNIGGLIPDDRRQGGETFQGGAVRAEDAPYGKMKTAHKVFGTLSAISNGVMNAYNSMKNPTSGQIPSFGGLSLNAKDLQTPTYSWGDFRKSQGNTDYSSFGNLDLSNSNITDNSLFNKYGVYQMPSGKLTTPSITSNAYGTCVSGVPSYSVGTNFSGIFGGAGGMGSSSAGGTGGADAWMNLGNLSMEQMTDMFSGKKPTVGHAVSASLKGSSAGFQAGGPLGAIIGGAMGTLTSTAGNKGRVDAETGDVTERSGWIGALFGKRSNNDLYTIGNGIKAAKNLNKAGQQFAFDAAQDYQQNDFTSAANGSAGLGNTLAYLDDGELIRTPNGQISEIPEEGKPTDSNLMNVPVGTQVLSDKLKVPGTKYTFAELGKKLMKQQEPIKGDRYSETSAMLNEQNNQMKYSELIQLQEKIQNRKKLQMPGHYEDGTGKTGVPTNTTGGNYENWNKYMLAEIIKRINNLDPAKAQEFIDWWNGIQQEHSVLTDKYGHTGFDARNAGEGVAGTIKAYQKRFNDTGLNDVIWNNLGEGKAFGPAPKANTGDSPATGGQDDVWYGWTDYIRHLGIGQGQLDALQDALNAKGIDGYLGKDAFGHVYLKKADGSVQAVDPAAATVADPKDDKKPVQTPQITPEDEYILRRRPDLLTNAVNTATLNAAISDYINLPKPNRYDPALWTPQYGPTDYNINPQLAETALSDRIAQYNAAQLNPSTGANMAFGLQAATNRDRQIAQLYADKLNNENRMRQANVSIFNPWAKDISSILERADDINARRNDNYLTQKSKLHSNIYTVMQGINKDRLQNNKDFAYMQMIAPTMNQAMTRNQADSFYNTMGMYKQYATPNTKKNGRQ